MPAPDVGFAVLPNWIARDGTIEPALKTLLLALSSYAGTDQTCFPSNSTLQGCTGLSERTVRDWLREGERRGLVVAHRRVDPATGAPTSNLYELNFGKWSNPLARQILPGVSADFSGGWGGASPQVGRCVAPGWGDVSPPNNTSEQNQITKPDQDTPTPNEEGRRTPTKGGDVHAVALIASYNEHCPSLPKCAGKVGSAAHKAAGAAWRREPVAALWVERFKRAEASELLSGRKTEWRADLTWILKPANAEKIDAGNYDNRRQGRNNETDEDRRQTAEWLKRRQAEQDAMKDEPPPW